MFPFLQNEVIEIVVKGLLIHYVRSWKSRELTKEVAYIYIAKFSQICFIAKMNFEK
jgi:hypothetical protein